MIRKRKIKGITALLCIFTMLTIGCIEKATDTGKQILDDGNELFRNGIEYIQDNLPQSISALKEYIANLPLESLLVLPEDPKIVKAIATLEPIDDKSLDYFEGFHAVADGSNAIANILDKEGDMDIGFEGTREEYEKVSKVVTKWTPIIGNYNNLVYSARAYDERDPKTIEEYYQALGLFCFEISIIYSNVWWKPTYAIVGKLYRVSGLNRLAFRCPSAISYILSTAHWGLRNYLTNTATDSAEGLIDKLTENEVTPDIKRIVNDN